MGGLLKLLGAAGVAAAAWYLLDPKNGADRRDKLASNAKDIYDSASKEITKMGEELATNMTGLVDKVTKATGMGASNGSAASDFAPGSGSAYSS